MNRNVKKTQTLDHGSCSGIAYWGAVWHHTLAAISAVFLKQSQWESKIFSVFAIPFLSFLELFMTNFITVIGSNLNDGGVL